MNKIHKIPTGGGAQSKDWAPCTRGGWPLWVGLLSMLLVGAISRLWQGRILETEHQTGLSFLDSSQAWLLFGVTTAYRFFRGLPSWRMVVWRCQASPVHSKWAVTTSHLYRLYLTDSACVRIMTRIFAQTNQVWNTTTSPSADSLLRGCA